MPTFLQLWVLLEARELASAALVNADDLIRYDLYVIAPPSSEDVRLTRFLGSHHRYNMSPFAIRRHAKERGASSWFMIQFRTMWTLCSLQYILCRVHILETTILERRIPTSN